MTDLWRAIDKVTSTYNVLWHVPVLYVKDTGIIRRGSKQIVSVPDKETAQVLITKLHDTLNKNKFLVNDYAKQQETGNENEKKPYPLNIRTINVDNADGTIALSKTRVIQTRTVTKADIIDIRKKEAANQISYWTMFYKDDKDSLETAIHNAQIECMRDCDSLNAKLDNLGKYKLSRYKSGVYAYRITYFDNELKKRRQTSVGDIVIAIGAQDVIEGHKQKRRTDRILAQSDIIARFYGFVVRPSYDKISN